MKKCTALVITSLLATILVHAQALKTGLWSGEIHYQVKSVPMSFEISYPNGETPVVTIINGKERNELQDVTITEDSITVKLTPFDVEIKAVYGAMHMQGQFIKKYRGDSFPFSAEYGKPRIKKRSLNPSPLIENRWAMVFEEGTSNESVGIGLFAQEDGVVTGTVLTTVSDYRFFEGIMDGDSIKASSFDGVHAFFLYGRKNGKKWEGEIVLDDNYKEKWIAKPDPEAAIEDPFEMVKVAPGKHEPFYDLLGAGSGKNVIERSNYANKVTIIQLFGTWCPNSQDQTEYLVDWYHENKESGVEVLASSYEANYSKEYGLKRIEEYKRANKIPYKVVLGGRLSKSVAAMPFPFMKRIEAFPTLVILDKQGYARYVHSYFNGPATGPYFHEFDQRFNQIIEELLAE